MIGFVDAFRRLKPDLIMLLGDRFEALAAASTAVVLRIPIVHLSGGDVTEGAFDDAIRHAITKMSHLHFVASAQAAARVRQMGEDPKRVFAVGDPGLDSLRRTKRLSRRSLERDLGMVFRRRNVLVTFHPVTLDRTLPRASSPCCWTRSMLWAPMSASSSPSRMPIPRAGR